MDTLTRQELAENESFFLNELQTGKIFIYPTDTIYGLGCNALDTDAVQKIRAAKERPEKAFSLIAPSKQRIDTQFNVHKQHAHALDKLPGPYTFILKVDKSSTLPIHMINPGGTTIGVRIPNNWFTDLVQKTGLPFITTSANVTGHPHITEIAELEDRLKKHVDYAIDDGKLTGNPSKIIDITGTKALTLRG